MQTVGFIGGKFLPFHLGHVYSIVSASNLVDKLYVILSASEQRDRELCLRDGIKYMPKDVRLSWLGGCLSDLENIRIKCIEDDDWENWGKGANAVLDCIPEKLTHTFSAESDSRDMFEKYYPQAEHVMLDRKMVDVSAIELRKNLYKNWVMLPEVVRSFFVKKIALVGTESCGKSTLAKKLAKYFNTHWVYEVGRDYCSKYLDQLTVDMFDSIAMDHYRMCENALERSNKMLFIDSEAVVTQYYLDMYFSTQSSLIEEIVKKQEYDLVLFLEPDIEWIDDGIRFAGDNDIRKENNDKLKQMFIERGFKFHVIEGSYKERFMTSKEIIEKMFS
ncbi:multifunctional transcriptional regulator/nicotinamide-nucleotide adenylyltransferase/ribosylnicotinamide kinase NadR [Francisellaceae bacterium]|nr:multifunctional transcriptional regulator/nicotinamide-nucleotide adenylyltransferase/ribosylnicotinamide kinase NadR [Francisellaceae bacterium]